MIEVEKKFRPTEEQLEAMLSGADFVGEKLLHDIYYDYPDYRLFKKEAKLRSRNGVFELKIGDDENAGISEEIENEQGIEKYLGTSLPLTEFISKNLIVIIDYVQKRKKYTKGEFTIDVDELDFGYSCVEVELLVAEEKDVSSAEKKLAAFVQSVGLKIERQPTKRGEYFRIVKPAVYKELYG